MAQPPPLPPRQGYPEVSQASTAVWPGVVGIVVCPLLGPVAWWMGKKELEAIDAARRPPVHRGKADAGRILGIVGTVLLGLSLLAGVAFVALTTVVAMTTS